MLTQTEREQLRMAIASNEFGAITEKLLTTISLWTDEQIRTKLSQFKQKRLLRLNTQKAILEDEISRLNI